MKRLRIAVLILAMGCPTLARTVQPVKHNHPLTAQTRHEKPTVPDYTVNDEVYSVTSSSVDCHERFVDIFGADLKISGVWFYVRADNWNGCENAGTSTTGGLGTYRFDPAKWDLGTKHPLETLRDYPKLVKFRWVEAAELNKSARKQWTNPDGTTRVIAVELADGNEWWYTVERPELWQDDGVDPTAAEMEKKAADARRLAEQEAAAAKALAASHAASRSN